MPNPNRLFRVPDPSVTKIIPKPDRLNTPEKQQAYRDVLIHFDNPDYQVVWVPTEKGKAPLKSPERDGKQKEQSGLTDEEKIFLTKEYFVRNLVADKWNTQNAIKRITGTLSWRREMGLDDVQGMGEELAERAQLKKLFVFGYSSNSMPMLYWWAPKKPGDPEADFKMVRMMIYCIERAIDLCVAGVEEAALMASLGGTPDRSWAAIAADRQILDYSATYYPERLGFAGVQNLAWYGRLLVNMLWPFVDPYTKSKIEFGMDFSKSKHVDPELVPKRFGGTVDYEPNPDTDWPELIKECLRRRRFRRDKWKELGGGIGLSEMDILPQAGQDLPADYD